MRNNEILWLKGEFQHRTASPAGPPTLPKGGSVSSEHLANLAIELHDACSFWESQGLGISPLVSAYYDRVIAKSNRAHVLLSKKGNDPNNSVVGARFSDEHNPKHIITYRVDKAAETATLKLLEVCIEIANKHYKGTVTSGNLAELGKPGKAPFDKTMPKSTFAKVIRDAFYISSFGVDRPTEGEAVSGYTVVTLFKTEREPQDLLRHYGIEVLDALTLGNSFLLNEAEYTTLLDKAPCLIAMTSDPNKWCIEDFKKPDTLPLPSSIPSPENEPTVGVIDTGFFEEVYFSEWVEVHNELSPSLCVLTDKDKAHGTAVASLIVDGEALNPELADGCGRFRVRHFVVAKSGAFSSFEVMKRIVAIVRSNPDIVVWNLSLGSELAVKSNSISQEASILDQLQYELGVVFVVAGTNFSSRTKAKRIGAPADSINAIVVNSVDRSGNPAVYSRKGPVLSFFAKPDICCFGGTDEDPIYVAAPYRARKEAGTSFAAPWITRKMAFLIHKMGLTREVAKALLVDSATGWNASTGSATLGYGVVPRRIEDILSTPKDEIRFFLTETLDSYETLTYQLPIPTNEKGFPFIARATLCYYPSCTREQGVDYTDAEVSLRLGRVDPGKPASAGKKVVRGKIRPINNDWQDCEGSHVDECTARSEYRKWDNIKHTGELVKDHLRERKTYGTENWGVGFCIKRRLADKDNRGIRVGLVVTLKEIHGANRIQEFKLSCQLRKWIVQPINIQQQIEIAEELETEVEFED